MYISLAIISLFVVACGLLLIAWWPPIGEQVSKFPVRIVERRDRGRPAAESPPSLLKVITFNIAYGRGPKDDLGDLRDRQTIEDFLDRISGFIGESGADIVALQEVDFDSKRTHRIDEAAYLAKRAGMDYTACVTTWHNRYIPYPYWPVSQHYGRMHSGQCVLSRFPLEDNTRYLLPQPSDNGFLYNLFYLHRSVQRVDAVIAPGKKLRIFNVHLEAFDKRNRMAQARILSELVQDHSLPSTLVLGDFNSLPPEAAKKHGFEDEPSADFRGDESIQVIRSIPGFAEVVESMNPARHDSAFFTFPSTAPSRRLDYIFYSIATLRPLKGSVVKDAARISDHLPVEAEFQLSSNAK